VTEAVIKKGATDTIPFMGLKIEENTNATNTTGTIFTAGASGAFLTGEAKKLGLNIFDDNDAQTTKIQVYERVYPCATVRTSAVGTLTDI